MENLNIKIENLNLLIRDKLREITSIESSMRDFKQALEADIELVNEKGNELLSTGRLDEDDFDDLNNSVGGFQAFSESLENFFKEKQALELELFNLKLKLFELNNHSTKELICQIEQRMGMEF